MSSSSRLSPTAGVAVAAGLATVAVLLVRAPRLGLPLLGGLIAVIAASVWVGVDADGASTECFSGELQEDATPILSLRENGYR